MIGLIGKKIGMTQIFDDEGILIPITAVEIEPNVVIGERTQEKNGYDAVILGAGKKKRVKKPLAGQFPENVDPVKTMLEFRNFEKESKIGDAIGPEILDGIRYVDVTASSKGKGYQGVMKRHGFSGGRKSHGSKFHRGLGSTGMAASPSKLFKGTRMPGRMGGRRTTVQNLRLLRVDAERNLLLIKGAIPGPRNGTVVVTKAKKR
jgi:large subunit ribosomal protein L3